jgi:hypothetical protein
MTRRQKNIPREQLLCTQPLTSTHPVLLTDSDGMDKQSRIQVSQQRADCGSVLLRVDRIYQPLAAWLSRRRNPQTSFGVHPRIQGPPFNQSSHSGRAPNNQLGNMLSTLPHLHSWGSASLLCVHS